MRVLGISAYYHDSAAALVHDGSIVAAVQEERFSRIKHDASFPHRAIEYCLNEAGVDLADMDHVVFYDKPFLKFERLLETYLAFAPRGYSSFRAAVPLWLREKLFLKRLLINELARHCPKSGIKNRLLFSEHHLSHAASAFYPSPFEEAVVITMDGVGEWATTSMGFGRGAHLEISHEIHFPHSLGLLYSAFTLHCGFKVNSGEYKLMGLAPYGEPRYVQHILDHLIDLKPDGSFRLDLSYFDYCTGLRMTAPRFDNLFGSPRQPQDPITRQQMDLAASVQAVIEEAVLRMTRSAADQWKVPNLCLAGGVALNCVANSKILKDGRFEHIWIQPAAGDAGGALGAALAAYHHHRGQPRSVDVHQDLMQGAYLGPAFTEQEIQERLGALGASFRVEQDETALLRAVARALAEGNAVGWFQGRMEFGPRALGARSILADPRSPSMQKVLNLKIKYRESFRPFAPAILREELSEWFDLDRDSPYMLLVADVKEHRKRYPAETGTEVSGLDPPNVPGSMIPAVIHVDGSARVQTVHRETNPRFHALIAEFRAQTGCPLLVNTSFNVRGEPIVCSPEDALRCFMGTELDMLVIGDCILLKEEQPAARNTTYPAEFEPD
jgi:carbamoyltransferase